MRLVLALVLLCCCGGGGPAEGADCGYPKSPGPGAGAIETCVNGQHYLCCGAAATGSNCPAHDGLWHATGGC